MGPKESAPLSQSRPHAKRRSAGQGQHQRDRHFGRIVPPIAVVLWICKGWKRHRAQQQRPNRCRRAPRDPIDKYSLPHFRLPLPSAYHACMRNRNRNQPGLATLCWRLSRQGEAGGRGTRPDRWLRHWCQGFAVAETRVRSKAGVDPAWVESVPQRVCQVVQTQQQKRQGSAGRDGQPGRHAEVGSALIQHGAPRGQRRPRA